MKKLGFGCMRLPRLDPQDLASNLDIELTKQLVDTYMDNGFNYFDTAYIYCGKKSESALRCFSHRAMPPDRRMRMSIYSRKGCL